LAFIAAMAVRQPIAQPIAKTLAAALVLTIATLTVGLTAAADGPFSIAVHPVFVRLRVDVDVKLGSLHLHATWSALPGPQSLAAEPQPSTKSCDAGL
jgi:hypothetical protein